MKIILEKVIGEINKDLSPEFPSGNRWEPGAVKLSVSEVASTQVETLGTPVKRVALIVENKSSGRPGMVIRLRITKGRVNFSPARQLSASEWDVLKNAREVFLDTIGRNRKLADMVKRVLISSEPPQERPPDKQDQDPF